MLSLRIDRDIEVPMRDGVVLRADVYRPSTTCERYPVLLQRTPYSKSNLMGSGLHLDPLRAASNGYAVVIQDTRGRFKSDGHFYPFANESKDGYDAVEWCAQQSWSNGSVGMYGSSYMAATALQAAKASPPHLVTVIPNQGSSDYYEGRSFVGGVFEVGSLLTTVLGTLVQDSVARLRLPEDEAKPLIREGRRLIDSLVETAAIVPLNKLREGVIGRVAPYFFDWMEHDIYDEYWESMSVEPFYDSIDLPAMHITCWYDSFLRGGITNYEGLTKAGKLNQRLVVGPWTHHVPMAAVLGSARVGDVNMGLRSMIDLDALQLAWFDHWMRGKKEPASGPPVRLYVMGKNEWRTYENWPPETNEERMYLTSRGHANSALGDGRLAGKAGSQAEYDEFIYDPMQPVPTLGGAHVLTASSHPPGSYDQREIESRSDVLVYTSDLLEDDLEAIGWVVADLWVSSSARDTDFMAKLVDVHPDGRAYNVCDGALRLALRHGFRSVSPYTPGEPVKIRIELGPTGHTFLSGHRVRLDVTSTNFPRFARSPNTGEPFHSATRMVSARQQVIHSSDRSSYLALQVAKPRRRALAVIAAKSAKLAK